MVGYFNGGTMQQEFQLVGDLPGEEAIAASLFNMDEAPRKQLPLSYTEGVAVRTVLVQVNGSERYDTHGRIQIEISGILSNQVPFRASLNYANPERSGIIFYPEP